MLEFKHYKRKTEQERKVIQLTEENFKEVSKFVQSIDGMAWVRNENTIMIPTLQETYNAKCGDYVVVYKNSYNKDAIGVYYKNEFEENFDII